MERNSNLWKAGVSVLLVLALLAYWFWPRGYGETSQRGYQFAIALFSACNQMDAQRLRTIDEMMQQAQESGELHDAEARWLRAIVRDGLNQDWDSANQAIRRLMNDQLKPAPDSS